MEDRSNLLKVYNDRTAILNRGALSCKDLEEYLFDKHILVSKPLISKLVLFSSISGSIRPELLIEAILQYLKGKRSYSKELAYIKVLFQETENIGWEYFKQSFSEDFSRLYENSEISRILQLIKRFGLGTDNKVTSEYLNQLVQTSKAGVYDVSRSFKKFMSIIRKVLISISWRKIKSPANTKDFKYINDTGTLKDIKNIQGTHNVQDKVLRKPLDIISNKLIKLDYDKSLKPRSYQTDRADLKSANLRNKLFFQSCKNFCSFYVQKNLRESFQIVKNPHKFRNPYVHRLVFKVYLLIKSKAQGIMSNALMKWTNIPESYIDFINSSAVPYVFSYKNSVNFSRQLNSLAFSQGVKDSNHRISALLIEKILKTPAKRTLREVLDQIFISYAPSIKVIVFYINKSLSNTLKQRFLQYSANVYIQKAIENYNKKNSYQNKRFKYSLANKAKKIFVRIILKLLTRLYLRIKFLKLKKNCFKPLKKLSNSFNKHESLQEPLIPPSKLSKSFAAPKDFSPKLSSRFDAMNFSVKKIKYHHGFEKLWIIYRKIHKKHTQNPLSCYLDIWKALSHRRKINISLPINKITRKFQSNQFSFRDH
jgi:hypothetical protein